jgi:glycosyltransferase involved in cell wall biosynthesis
MLISVIIITLNEAENLENTIIAVRRAAQIRQKIKIPIEIIISDGGSNDGTLEIAKKLADKVIVGARGRYRQLNAGARESNGDVLIFLHADTNLPNNAIVRICHKLKDQCIIGGGFKKDWRWSPNVKRTSFLNTMVYSYQRIGNFILKKFKLFPGDNAIFVRKTIYNEVGGFAPMWICEDFDFSLRLKKLTKKNSCHCENKEKKRKVVCIDHSVKTSTRRFEKDGFFKTAFLWFFIFWFWRLGMSQDHLRIRFKKYSTLPTQGNKKILKF